MSSNMPRQWLALSLSPTTSSDSPISGEPEWYRILKEQPADHSWLQEALRQWLDMSWKHCGPPSITFIGNTALIQFPPSPYPQNTGAGNDG